jgi:tetratricopeptide (TPR) repeat protein
MRELEEQARTRLGAKQYQEAVALLERAVREFPEVATFTQLLSEAREGFAPELKAQRLSAAEHSIRLRMAEQRYEEAVAEADAALSEHPGEKAIRSLRMQAAAGTQEKAAVAGVAGEVQRLIALGEGIESDRVLAEGLRRYPGRAELTILRPAVDAAQKTEANRKSREARLKRAVAGIGRLLGKGKQT